MSYIKISVVAFLILLSLVGCNARRRPSAEEIERLKIRVETGKPPQSTPNSENPKLWNWTKNVYESRKFRPAWSARGYVYPSADQLIRTLENAPAEGLRAEDFALSEVSAMRDAVGRPSDPAAEVEFDVQLTYSFVRYISQLCFGRIDPKAIDPAWLPAERDCDVQRIVHDALEQNHFESVADQVAPHVPEYKTLKAALDRYRGIAAQGGWKPLTADVMKQRAGLSSLLVSNLVLMGDLKGIDGGQTVSDEAVAEVVRRFQSRHGLESTGFLDEKTVRAMNVPVQDRIQQIEINLDRLRWMADDLGARHVRVNVPAFELTVHDGDQVPLQMRAIVGSNENRTPIFSGEMEYIVFSPYWNIPVSIATKELLPKIRQDVSYLERQQIEVIRVSAENAQTVDPADVNWDEEENNFRYQLRQKPGASNSLGLVKFIFPNPFNVYLHDTPSDKLFDRLTRTLSHGCIRLERPADLAAYVLQDQVEWTPEHIKTAMHTGREQHVALKRPLPVHIMYWTAWVDAEDRVEFREDVYAYDEKYRALTSR